MTDRKESKKSYFTPCRTVGLKRKSTGTPSSMTNTPKNDQTNGRNSLKTDCANSVSNNVETPKRAPIQAATSMKRSLKRFRKETTNADASQVELNPSNDKESDYVEYIDLEIQKVEKRISEKLEEIKRLESETLNVKQHDLEKLKDLTKKWRLVCQAVLNELHDEYKTHNESYSMLTLLNTLGIPASLVRYNDTEMEFQE